MSLPLSPTLLIRLTRLLQGLEPLLARHLPGVPPSAEALRHHFAWHWQQPQGSPGRLVPARNPDMPLLEDLRGIDGQKHALCANTARFALGMPANNALLWGARGTGKSSLVKAAVCAQRHRGLHLVEIHKEDLLHLPDIIALLAPCAARFVLFCDDLSFDEREISFKAMKAVLEGGIEARPDNILLYATSNRRHLMARTSLLDEPGSQDLGLHPQETVEEQISLSDRFGLWLGFHPMDHDAYMEIVRHWALRLCLGIDPVELERRARDWSRTRGARSGRTAVQFITDLAGLLALPEAGRD
ncbi:MAG: ATP-binding protein [Magnetococcus sp. WYHC-3]